MDTGIIYPTIQIAGAVYSLRLSMGAFFRLEQQGLDVQTLMTEVASWAPKTDPTGNVIEPGRVKVVVLLKILAASAMDANDTPISHTPEQVADALDLADLAEVAAAVSQAIAIAMAKMKPSAAKIRLQEPAAHQESILQQ